LLIVVVVVVVVVFMRRLLLLSYSATQPLTVLPYLLAMLPQKIRCTLENRSLNLSKSHPGSSRAVPTVVYSTHRIRKRTPFYSKLLENGKFSDTLDTADEVNYESQCSDFGLPSSYEPSWITPFPLDP
jgi:hypothetical protein